MATTPDQRTAALQRRAALLGRVRAWQRRLGVCPRLVRIRPMTRKWLLPE